MRMPPWSNCRPWPRTPGPGAIGRRHHPFEQVVAGISGGQAWQVLLLGLYCGNKNLNDGMPQLLPDNKGGDLWQLPQ